MKSIWLVGLASIELITNGFRSLGLSYAIPKESELNYPPHPGKALHNNLFLSETHAHTGCSPNASNKDHLSMGDLFCLIFFSLFIVTQIGPAEAKDSMPHKANDSWTEIGAYGFMTDIGGNAKLSNVTVPVDVSFSDILENLEMGFMGFAEYRNDKWSLIGDVFYANLEAEQSLAVTSTASVRVDAVVKQLMTEGFVGYRVAEQIQDGKKFGLDVLVGARYNSIDVEIGLDATQLGLGAAARNPSIDWVDGVIGLRAQYGGSRGWGASAWADFGKGADSSSHQFSGIVNYRFDNSVNLFGGYRLYNFKYETGSGTQFVELDLDFKGPMLGISYRL